MGTKAAALHKDENRWSGFLYDKDSRSAIVQRFFKPGEHTQYPTDPETVVEARAECRTIVTSNGADFIRYVRDAQENKNLKDCQDCWGLVILPNRDYERENALRIADIGHGIRLGPTRLGHTLIPWKAIGFANLCVTVEKSGQVKVSKEGRCPFCERDYPIPTEWGLVNTLHL